MIGASFPPTKTHGSSALREVTPLTTCAKRSVYSDIHPYQDSSASVVASHLFSHAIFPAQRRQAAGNLKPEEHRSAAAQTAASNCPHVSCLPDQRATPCARDRLG